MFQMYISAPTDGIALPDPEIGDIRRIETNVINRDSRGGEHLAFKDATWPNNELFSWSWALLNDTEKSALETFFITNAGLEVTIVDHNDDEWVGVLSTDTLDIRILESGCSYTVALDFIGAKV